MITLADATARVLATAAPLDAVELPLDAAGGLVLRHELVARIDAPPFDASAMDGYAVRCADLAGADSAPIELTVVGTSSCGRPSPERVETGTAVRILTGAVVPAGADGVVPVEGTDGGSDRVVVRTEVAPGACIRRRGEVSRIGDVLVAAGTQLHAGHLALAASEGLDRLVVTRRPRVAVVSTGDELVPPGRGPLGEGRIHDSNSTLMAELARSVGAEVLAGSAGDDADALRVQLDELSGQVDLLLTSGGVSMGAEFDPLRAAVAEHPVEFWQVAIKPAKPLAFGRLGGPDGAIYLGLPGNPFAVLVSFELFVRPLLDALRGLPARPPRTVTGRAAHTIDHADDDKTHLVPVRHLATGEWSANELVGSHALVAGAAADALAVLDPSRHHVAAGDELTLLPLWR